MEGTHHNLPPHQYHNYQPCQIPHQHQIIDATTTSSDRFPQWSFQETKEFLMIRSELDQTFMKTKRNKVLWEAISNHMKEKGYNRSHEQCKCKWKNLVTRYKGCETMEPEAVRQQFPFYHEMQSIFAGRIQRMLWAEAEGGDGSSKRKAEELSSDSEDQDNINNEEYNSETEKYNKCNVRKKKKKAKVSSGGNIKTSTSSGNINSGVGEMLEGFMKQQMEIEMQWMEVFEAREKERRLREVEWRDTMRALENERLVMDRGLREREEQRRVSEEIRAEKRDALINELLNRLTNRRDDHDPIV